MFLFFFRLFLNWNVIALGASQVVQWAKNLPASTGDAGSIPESGRSPGVGNGNALQHSYLKNSMGRGAWWATAQRVANETDTT